MQALAFTALSIAPFNMYLRQQLSLLIGEDRLVDPFSTASATWQDALAVYSFLISGILLFTASASFHCFRCHSPEVCLTSSIADHIGIALLIVGSTVPCIYYGFYDDRLLQIAHLSVLFSLGSACIFMLCRAKYRSEC